jgi:8-oxo-dGTP pyrophosphatase MutT (NUDIX family)
VAGPTPAGTGKLSRSRALLFPICLAVAGCGAEAPPCPGSGSTDSAPSAGCFIVEGDALLVVQGLDNAVSLPGGASRAGESARCTAHRETWEETGVDAIPGERLLVFDTGFYLYRCEAHTRPLVIDPPTRLEVRRAFLLKRADFAKYDWRYPGQRAVLEHLLLDETRTD